MTPVMATEGPFDPCDSPEVAAYVRGLVGAGPPLETRLDPADEMFRYDLATPYASRPTAAVAYFATGRQIFEAVAGVVAWRFQGFGGVRSLLDFASGYGRSTRFLVEALAPGKITVAEIDPAAVRFQQETFGVRGVAAGSEPESLALEGSFDVVVASSFFSHLPAARFEAWLARLYALVALGGVLIFSAHGMGLLPEGEPIEPSGIAFRPVSETQRLEGTEYGTSYVSPEFVRRVAARGGRDGRGRAPRRAALRAVRVSGPLRPLPASRSGGTGPAPAARAARRVRPRRRRERDRRRAGLGRGRPRRAPARRAAASRRACRRGVPGAGRRRAPGGTGVSRSPWPARTRTRSCASRR